MSQPPQASPNSPDTSKRTIVGTGPRLPPRPPPQAVVPSREGVAATLVAVPGVAPGVNRPTNDDLDEIASRETQTDFQAQRHALAGTRMSGTEGLAEPGTESPRLRLVPGKVVPGTRYRITRWLGEGGMGVVYEAEHIDIERKVALKILRFDLSQEPQMAQVFRDEARAASKIGSKNIVEIFDFGELADGRLFFCMELLPGGDLVPASEDDWIEPGRLIGLLRQICKGLAAAHDSGIVHRDIKPENVILIEVEGREVVKIVDFGISTMLSVGKDQSNTIAGTPHYMAPEQINGGEFDGRLDMYALGCMAYELLVGHPPFLAEGVQELLQQQLYSAPPPISQVRPDREIPKSLADTIMKCLAKEPENRWKDMRDFEAALCEAQIAAGLTTPWDDLPLPNVDQERRERLLKQMPSPHAPIEQPRNRWLWPAVAAGALLVGALGSWLLFGGKPTDEQVAEIEDLTTQARQAAGKTQWVYPPLDEPSAPTSYQKVIALENLEGAADEPGDERAEELRQEFASNLLDLGERYWEVPGAKGFARDYYMMAMLFDPENELAKERAGLTPGEFADFRDRAANGDFTDEELRSAGWLDVLAIQDKGEAAAKAEELLAMAAEEEDEGSVMVQAKALRAVRGAGIAVKAPAAVPQPEPVPEPTPDPVPTEPVDDAALVVDDAALAGDVPPVPDDPGTKKTSKKPKSESLGGATRDPDKAAELAKQGMAALDAGRRDEAKGLFNNAIAYDQRNAMALMGLSDVFFDTGSDQKAVLYAEKAVQAAPSNSGYRLKLGDAYYKVLRYRDALEQYEKAKSLGSTKADARIDKVKDKVGG
jgi:serine/threonine protein kinase